MSHQKKTTLKAVYYDPYFHLLFGVVIYNDYSSKVGSHVKMNKETNTFKRHISGVSQQNPHPNPAFFNPWSWCSCQARLRRFPASTHLIQMIGSSLSSDNDPFIWIRCVGALAHLKHAWHVHKEDFPSARGWADHFHHVFCTDFSFNNDGNLLIGTSRLPREEQCPKIIHEAKHPHGELFELRSCSDTEYSQKADGDAGETQASISALEHIFCGRANCKGLHIIKQLSPEGEYLIAQAQCHNNKIKNSPNHCRKNIYSL